LGLDVRGRQLAAAGERRHDRLVVHDAAARADVDLLERQLAAAEHHVYDAATRADLDLREWQLAPAAWWGACRGDDDGCRAGA
jgi:hypothetical protein